MEDLLEELVGEIIDESDVEEQLVKKLDRKTVHVDGDAEIKAIENSLQSSFPGKLTETISEVILKKIKRIPKKGEIVNLRGYEVTIVSATKKKIKKVMIKEKA